MIYLTHGRAVAARPAGGARTTPLSPRRCTRGPLSRVRPHNVTGAACWRALPVIAALLTMLVLAATGCGSASEAAPDSAAGESREMNVFAAASLTEVFTRIGDEFTAAHPDVTIAFNFAGSNDLVTQLQQGAPADVLATADTTTMYKAGDLVDEPCPFAANKLVVAVAPGNPKGITGLADLSRKDLKVVLAAPEVPAGKYATEILSRTGVQVEPVSLEVTVKGVVTKIALGEADAGIVYITDVTAANGEIEDVVIPDDQNVVAVYPLGPVAASGLPADAAAFIDFVLGTEGQDLLAEAGFLTAP
jgi:molybdate transport system substrate-binding protein